MPRALRRSQRPRSAPAVSAGRIAAPGTWARRAQLAAEALLWALLLATPFVVQPSLSDAFDLPKLMLSEVLALASLIPLAGRLAAAGAGGPRAAWALPAVRAALPAAAVATIGWAFAAHPAPTRDALADLWIGAACLIGWSVALDPARLRRLLAGLTVPASVLAALAIAQFHGLYRPFEFAGGEEGARLGVTSLAGNAGVLADYLVLPALAAQWLLARWWRRRRAAAAAAGAALALCLYALAATQTVTALAALALGSAVLWLTVLPRRRALAALALTGALLLAAIGLVPALRQKVSATAAEVAAGAWGRALEGRTDGWRAALWMAGRHPLTGVGHGAYDAEFADAKLELAGRGARFFRGQELPSFANAHSEYLEAAAEWGLPGAAALGWALWVLIGAVRRRLAAGALAADDARSSPCADAGLATGGALALAVMAAGHFPFRVGLVAFPALLFLAWVLAPADESAGAAPRPAPASRRPLRAAAVLLAALLALALAGQAVRAGRRLEANRILHQVEQVSLLAAGKAPAALFWTHARMLERARGLDPADSRIPLALGSQYLLLGRPEEAAAAYREALAVAPRPEIYLNLGRAQAVLGDLDGARESFRRAVVLDPGQRPLVPRELRTER